ncbi:MAG: type 1 glutamine amidotransferase [Acidimicrobiales bacterium]
MKGRDSVVTVALLYPELLGTYGDGGNSRVLVQRLGWRDFPVQLVEVPGGTPPPRHADVYLLGGGEDGPMALAVGELGASRALSAAMDGGAAVLAVCAGFQLLGEEFAAADGSAQAGLGFAPWRSARGRGRRHVGEVVVEPDTELGLPILTGYENHQGITTLEPGARPLGRVVVGSGNHDGADPVDGAVHGRVVGTYLHGPVLARNPALADLLLSWVVGPLGPIPGVDDGEVEALRKARLAEARNGRAARILRRLSRR